MRKTVIAVLICGVVVGGIFALLRRQSVIRPDQQLNPNTIRVTTSFYPLYFFSKEVGGDKVQVTNITPPGAEPHDYEPTTQDMVSIQKSNILLINGNVEPWAQKVTANIAGSNVKILVAGEGLFTQTITEEGEVTPDPHIWLSPRLAKQEVTRIAETFKEVDPSAAEYFDANAANLLKRLDELDQAYRGGLSQCKSQEIITAHAAFGYMASEYGLEQVAIAGLSPDEEPSPRELADVAKFAKQKNIQYIFFEQLVSPKLAETIAAEIGAKTLVLDPLEGISDADMSQGKDYFSVMKQNLENLQIALQCTK